MTDHDAMKNCPPQLMYLIETKGLMLEQVFNAEEMGLFWKRMPFCTFLSKQERSPQGQGDNAADDFIMLPMIQQPSQFHIHIFLNSTLPSSRSIIIIIPSEVLCSSSSSSWYVWPILSVLKFNVHILQPVPASGVS